VKVSKKLLGIILAVVAVVGIILGIVLIANQPKPKEEKKILTTSTLKEVIDISELSTAEFYYNGVVSVAQKNNPNKIAYSVKYDSTVKVGIDAEKIRFEIDAEQKTVRPILPEIVINSVEISQKSISTIPEKTDAKLKDVLQLCQNDAKTKANKNEDLIQTATVNLQNTLTALLTPILSENGYTIIW